MLSNFSTRLFASLGLLLSAANLSAEEISAEYIVKAAFLYNFGLYTEWPLMPAETFDFCVLGKDTFGIFLDNIGKKPLQGKAIHIRRLPDNTDAKGCHLLFVPATEKDTYNRLAPMLLHQATLTITDAQQMDERWPTMMVTMIPDGARFTFEINQTAAKTAGLTFSSKLLRLARKVK